jgi:hypothetical protein
MEKVVVAFLGVVLGTILTFLYIRIVNYIKRKRGEKDELQNKLRNFSNDIYNLGRTIDLTHNNLSNRIHMLENPNNAKVKK